MHLILTLLGPDSQGYREEGVKEAGAKLGDSANPGDSRGTKEGPGLTGCGKEDKQGNSTGWDARIPAREEGGWRSGAEPLGAWGRPEVPVAGAPRAPSFG